MSSEPRTSYATPTDPSASLHLAFEVAQVLCDKTITDRAARAEQIAVVLSRAPFPVAVAVRSPQS